jgi:hypothetical protein
MKEEDLVREMLQARVKFYRTITFTLLSLVSICVVALALTIFIPTRGDKEVIILFITLTAGLFGAFLTIVTEGIQAARRLRSDEELAEGIDKIQVKKINERKS